MFMRLAAHVMRCFMLLFRKQVGTGANATWEDRPSKDCRDADVVLCYLPTGKTKAEDMAVIVGPRVVAAGGEAVVLEVRPTERYFSTLNFFLTLQAHVSFFLSSV